MAASDICHSWSPFADNSASFLVTSSFVKAGTVFTCCSYNSYEHTSWPRERWTGIQEAFLCLAQDIDRYLRSASMAYNSLNTSGRSLRFRSSTLRAPYLWSTPSTTADPNWELIVDAVFSILIIQFSRSSLVTFFISFLLSLPFRSQLRYLHHPWKLNSSLIKGCIQGFWWGGTIKRFFVG